MEVNVHHAKTHLSKLIAAVEAGEEVIIARNGKPAVKLVAALPAQPEYPDRIPGRLKARLNLPDDWEEQFERIGKELEDIMIDGPLMHDPAPPEPQR